MEGPIRTASATVATEALVACRENRELSALLMMAPSLPNGLEIVMTGKIMSRPYIEMTLGLMSRFGATYSWNDHLIKIPRQTYSAITLKVESDWSAASYWYSLVSMADKAQITLNGLRKNSYQGDQQISSIMEQIGVQAHFQPELFPYT